MMLRSPHSMISSSAGVRSGISARSSTISGLPCTTARS